MLSFGKSVCKPPSDVKKNVDENSSRFYQQVLGEELRLHDYHQKEIQSTMENPRIRDQADTTDISTELKELKRQQFLEQKRRQQLRANNEELRILEMQLRCAYVTKELVDQKAEHERMRQEELRQKKEDAQRFEAERRCTQEDFDAKYIQEQHKKNHIRSLLHEQMAEIRHQRLQEYEQVLHERTEMQKLVERMKAEDKAEREALLQRRSLEKEEVDEYLRNRELYKLHQQAQKMEEHDKYMEMRKQRDAEEQRKAEEKRQQLAERTAMSERIGRQIHNIETEKKQRESLLTDLLIEERKAVQDLQYRLQLQRQMRQRQNTLLELNAAREKNLLERTKAGEMSEEDKRFYEEEMRVLAERDKLEQLSNERRRRLQQEHRRGLLTMIEERKSQRVLQTAENLYQDTEELRSESKRLQEVEKERSRMLEGHSAEVLRYLPTNSLRVDERKMMQKNDVDTKTLKL